ncbi:MAG: hypothetical protein ACFFCW_23075 [Candidatus Hodarchaeota archaeon]
MGQTTEQIIQKVVQQTNLQRKEVLERIEQLRQSLKYGSEDDILLDADPTIPKLFAQELNVDLGDPMDYLYTELIFDNWQLFARIIPLTTINKEKIIKKLKTIGPELEARLLRDSHETYGLEKYHSLGKIFLWQRLMGDV